MEVTPQFFDAAGNATPLRSGICYVYIEVFGGSAVLPKVEAPGQSLRAAYPEVEKDLAAVRSRLNDAGLGCHKEALGLPDALGHQVIQKEYFQANCDGKLASPHRTFRSRYVLKGSDDKMLPLIAFCVLTLQKNGISPQNLAQMVGGFTWFLLINRPLLSVFDEFYSFQNVYWHASFSKLSSGRR